MKKLLLLLPLLLMVSCNTATIPEKEIDYDYSKVHIYEVGCVPKSRCNTIWLRTGYAGTALIEYTDDDGNKFVTSSYALVQGDCPICDVEH